MSAFLQHYYGISNRPAIALAPMAGVTDLPFRTLCEELGADYSVTEMAATAPQLLHSDKNQSRLHFTPTAHVNILQIIGNDAQQMANAAQHYADLGADIIDINLGCPAKKINRKGAGSALLGDLDNVKEILTTVTRHCPVPVTVKTRLGTDHENYTLLAVGEIAADLGIELLTVHGRTRSCKFNGKAQFTEITKLKQRYPQLTILANGDINSLDDVQRIINDTACDGVMIGRSAVGNPWLFSEIKHYYNNTTPTINEKSRLIIQHIQNTHLFYGQDKGVRFARKHIQAYLRHLGLSQYFSQLAEISCADTQLAHLESILDSYLIETKH